MPLRVCLGCSSTGSGRIRTSAAACGREGSCGSISLTPQDKPVTLVSYRCCLLGSPLFCWAEKEAKQKLGLPYFGTPNKNVHPKRVARTCAPVIFAPPVDATCPCGCAWDAPPRAAVGFGSAPPPADVKEVADRLASATCGRGLFRESPKWCFSLTAKDKPMTLVSYRCCLLGSPLFCWAEKEAKRKLANNNSHPNRLASTTCGPGFF